MRSSTTSAQGTVCTMIWGPEILVGAFLIQELWDLRDVDWRTGPPAWNTEIGDTPNRGSIDAAQLGSLAMPFLFSST